MTLLELVSNCINFITQDDEDINPLTLNEFKNSENYKSFIKNALPEINRAIQQIVIFKKIPLKVFEKEFKSIDYINAILKIDISEIKKEIYSIFKVEFFNQYNQLSIMEHRREANNLIIVNPKNYGKLIIKYYPKVRMLTNSDFKSIIYENYVEITLNDFVDKIKTNKLENGMIYKIDNQLYQATSNNSFVKYQYEVGSDELDTSIDLETLGLDEVLCQSVIPYLVKSKLWQEIEPQLAQIYYNEGIQNLNLIENGDFNEPYQTYVCQTTRW